MIEGLCPGPDVPIELIVRYFGILPSLSLSGTVGSPLVRYASRPATRCSNVGAGVVACASGMAEALGDGEPEGEAVCAKSDPGVMGAKQRTEGSTPYSNIFFLKNIWTGFSW